MSAFLTPVETVAQRVRRLQAEAKALARDQIAALCDAIVHTEALALEVASGGDAYPSGIRDLARRYAAEAEARVLTIEALLARQL